MSWANRGRGYFFLLVGAALAVILVTLGALRFNGAQANSPAQEPHTSPVGIDPSPSPRVPPKETEQLALYEGSIEHIFFHPLVVYPELAFDKDAMAKGYDDWFVTVPEFKRIIEQLHRHNYVLVDLRSLYEEREENGHHLLVRKELWLPPGKKPLVMSIDDMNYYEYMRANGNVYRLVVGDDGRIAAESVTPTGVSEVSYDNEIVPILDAFVAEHPDFSFRGAKGLIALTGYEGILGYRTNELDSPVYQSEKQAALKVVQRLKETGWYFASHGWGHLDARKVNYQRLVHDTERWMREVEPLIGKTSIYVYPHGASVLPGDPKFSYLLENGFRVLCSVGPTPYLQATSDYMMMDRRHIDGVALKTQRKLLLKLFDASEVIDSVRPR